MAQTRDMTTGSPSKLILSFALPVVLGNAFQQLYSLVDSLVVGRGVGVEAFAAVGSAGWLDYMVISSFIGIAQGFAIRMSQRFGAGDIPGLKKTAGQSLILMVLMGFLFTITAQVLLYPLLRLMDTPPETIHITYDYCRTLFWGISITACYNIFAAFHRALGNSRTPLVATSLACGLNILLDLLFVLVFHWGVKGAALATLTAQFFAALLCAVTLFRLPVMHLDKHHLQPDIRHMLNLLSLGLPVAFQNVIISIGGLMLQTAVNGYGYIAVAGFTASSRISSIMEMAGTSFGSAMNTYAGQNLGAGKIDRIRMGLKSTARLAVVVALTLSLVVFLLGKPLIALFVTGEAAVVAEVVDYAFPYLCYICAFMWVLYLLFVYRSTLQGLGNTVVPMWSGFIELAMRLIFLFSLKPFLGITGVYIAEIMAWVGATILLTTGCYRMLRRLPESPSV